MREDIFNLIFYFSRLTVVFLIRNLEAECSQQMTGLAMDYRKSPWRQAIMQRGSAKLKISKHPKVK